MSKLYKAICIFCTLVVGIIIGYAWKTYHIDTLWNRQLESQLRDELAKGKPLIFKIPDSCIYITKLRDGSGIIRLEEKGDK